MSYTKLDGSGNVLSGSATSWVMVRDNVTGLIWDTMRGACTSSPATTAWAIYHLDHLAIGSFVSVGSGLSDDASIDAGSYTDNGDGSVTETSTRLTWQQAKKA
jgi:hypothetical protein